MENTPSSQETEMQTAAAPDTQRMQRILLAPANILGTDRPLDKANGCLQLELPMCTSVSELSDVLGQHKGNTYLSGWGLGRSEEEKRDTTRSFHVLAEVSGVNQTSSLVLVPPALRIEDVLTVMDYTHREESRSTSSSSAIILYYTKENTFGFSDGIDSDDDDKDDCDGGCCSICCWCDIFEELCGCVESATKSDTGNNKNNNRPASARTQNAQKKYSY